MKNRWIALALCLLMALSLLPTIAAAEEQTDKPAAAVEPHVIVPAAKRPALSTEPGTLQVEDPETKELCAFVPVETKGETERASKIYFNSSNFPDKTFRELLKSTFGRDYMTSSEAESIKTINVTGMGIANLKGVTYFINLEVLYCGAGYDEDGNVVARNNLSSLDVKSLRWLKELYCDSNKLTKLDISGMVNLHILVLDDNPIATLTMKENMALGELYCANTKIKLFNFEKAEVNGLEKLDVSGIGLTSIDVSKQKKLRWFYCNDNALTALSIGGCEQLERLVCFNNKLKSLDLSQNEHLGEVYCASNRLTSIKFKPWDGFSTFDCSNNKLTSLNLRITSFSTLCVDNNQLSDIDVSHMQQLGYLYCDNNRLTHLKLATTGLRLSCRNNLLTEIDSPIPEYMLSVDCSGNRIGALDLSVNRHLEVLLCSDNQLSALDLSHAEKLKALDCSDNQIEALDLSACTALQGLACRNNRLAKLDLEACEALEELYCDCGGQRRCGGPLTESDGKYLFDFNTLGVDPGRVEPFADAGVYDNVSGILTFDAAPTKICYTYDTYADTWMGVTLIPAFLGDGTVGWTDPAIAYKGATPYMVHTGSLLLPAFEVKDANGQVLDPVLYTCEFVNNREPGTATLNVRFVGTENTCSAWFKIYLPATTETKVVNTKGGVKITWTAVEGAKGYVIYRRAWSSTTNGWTDFKRWNNTTETTWTDTQVYAGTRYQYGVKAYFAERENPDGTTMGGAMDNYNLGMVGPLKTTVRITTRTLNSVTGGTKQITAKWGASKNFTGYQVQVATDEKFTQNRQTFTIDNAQTTSYTVKSLKANTTYYVRVRSYHIFEGTTYYGGWSNVRNAKTK